MTSSKTRTTKAVEKAASKTRASKTVEKSEETTISHEMPGYKALSEEEMRRDLAEADIYAQAHALIPYQMRGNAGDMYLLMQIAKHLNVPFITALRGLSFIGDKDVKPAMTAQLMSALVRNAGHTLREQWDPETNTATAVIIRKDDPQFEHVAVWDEEKARVAGLWDAHRPRHERGVPSRSIRSSPRVQLRARRVPDAGISLARPRHAPAGAGRHGPPATVEQEGHRSP